MIVLSMCCTKLNVLVSYILKKSIYKNDRMILLLSDLVIEVDFINYVMNMNIWEEVLHVKEIDLKAGQIRQEIEDIYNQYEHVDIAHVFTIGHMSSHFVNNLAPDETRVILTDSDDTARMPLNLYNNWKKFDRSFWDNEFEEFKFSQIKEVLLFDGKSFDGSLNIPVTEIDIATIFNKDDLKAVNQLFRYQHRKETYDILLCESYSSHNGLITKECEDYLRDKILKICSNKKCLIKLHPHGNWEEQLTYDFTRVSIMEDHTAPVEVFFLNYIMDNRNKLYVINENSSFSYNALIFCEKLKIDNVKVVDRIGINKKFYNSKNGLEYKLGEIKRYNSQYKNNIFIPDDWESICTYIGGTLPTTEEKNDLQFTEEDYSRLVSENYLLKKQADNMKKYQLYFKTENFLLRLYAQGYNLHSYFTAKRIQHIAVYGIGDFAERVSEILGKEIVSCYILSRLSESCMFLGKEVVSVDKFKESDYYQEVQGILITPIHAEKDIMVLIDKNHINKTVIKFSDIVNFFG